MAEPSDRIRQKTPAAPLYLFRGRSYPLSTLFTPLLDVLATAPTDREATQLVTDLVSTTAPSVLLPALLVGVSHLEIDYQPQVLTTLAGLAAATPARLTLLESLTPRTESASRCLALALVARLPMPLTSTQLASIHALLGDRRVPRNVRLEAVAQLCRTTLRVRDARGIELLRAYLGSARRGRALRRLAKLQARLGAHPLLDGLTERLERRARMTCPRCKMHLRRPKMVRHLWEAHRLVLEGRKVRDPWSLIDDWLRAQPRNIPSEVLDRCQALAQRIDPTFGPPRLQQRLQALHPAPVPEPNRPALDIIPADASSCPRCATMVPVTLPLPVPQVLAGPGRISAENYEVAVRRRGLRTRLQVRIGQQMLIQGAEPGQRLTPNGAIVALAGPLVVLALAIALGWIAGKHAPLKPVLLLLATATGTGLLARWGWNRRAVRLDRLVDYAWTIVVPRLHAVEFSVRDSAFLSGLARISSNHGQPAARALLLTTMTSRTQHALTANAGLVSHFAALRRLAIHDAVADGGDPVPLLVDELERCFEGRLPLRYAQELLDNWTAIWWTEGKQARLRVLLCDRAFEVGLEVGPLLALAEAAPALGRVLGSGRPELLAQLRLLWSLRPMRPWDHIGPASNVFEWAARPESEDVLDTAPDVLLLAEETDYQAVALPDRDEMRPVQLLVTSRGLLLQGVLFAQAPTHVEILRTGVLFRAGHELKLDGKRFRFNRDPEPVSTRLEKWCRFLWSEFLPQTGRAATWQSPMVKRLLRPPGAGACPRCNAPLLLRAGQMAVELPQVGSLE